MIIPDVNLLVYAHMTADPRHPEAARWLAALLDGTEPVGVCHPAIFGFIRICTHARIFETPLTAAQSISVVQSWLVRPQVEVLVPGPRYFDRVFDLLRETGTAGDLTTDAQLAAFAIENNAELHSANSDFGRFSGLRWINPLAKR